MQEVLRRHPKNPEPDTIGGFRVMIGHCVDDATMIARVPNHALERSGREGRRLNASR